MPLPTYSRSEIEQIIRRKIELPAYRQAFLRSPRTKIEEQLGAPLPGDVSITVLEEGPHLLYVVLPYVVPAGQELSDLELEHVAGGKNDNYYTTGAGQDSKN